VKEAGGMVMVQTPESADYASMPQHALETGLVDYTLPPEEMPAQLLAYSRHTSLLQTFEAVRSSDAASQMLQKIYLLLRTQMRHDFSDYKQNTILRRIERRMVIHQLDHLADYLHYLQQNPREVSILFYELLIGVTHFFRDADIFAALKSQVIPQLFDGKTDGESVRVWVPACSTGEEAYSLAMLLHDFSASRNDDINVQLFATDIDTRALDTARAGIYPANIVADVPPEHLCRYFIEEQGSYRVHPIIRDMVVFAEQDIILDPPFSHLDLISCRNLLIYLNGGLQKKLLPLFHYALNANGFLFLGSSETVGELTDLFAVRDFKNKLYQRKEVANLYRILPGVHPPMRVGKLGRDVWGRSMKPAAALNLRNIVESHLLAHDTPPCVLINEAEEVLYVHGSTGNYLEPAAGDANFNLLRMARPGLRMELSAAVHKAIALQEPVQYSVGLLLVNEQVQTVNLRVCPVIANGIKGLFLVVFDESAAEQHAPFDRASPVEQAVTEQRMAALERELRTKDEYLQTHFSELTIANEELQSSNEELQSINEEMDTSREELQSVNEELTTVNTELQKKIEELSLANDDMNNLLAGTDVGTVFIDHDLRIKRYTPAATAIVNLIPSDIGRPIGHLATNLVHYDDLLRDAQQVFETLKPKEVEVRTIDGRWYLMRILPYRTLENVIDGVVITFVNITVLREMQDRFEGRGT